MGAIRIPSITGADWVNHLIGFIGTLLGIFIALQLDDWQERQKQNERLSLVMQSLRLEIENNQNIYRRNISRLSDWLDYYHFIESHLDQQTNLLLMTNRDLEAMKAQSKDRFKQIQFVRKYNDTLSGYSFGVLFDVLPETTISTGNWDAARGSGVLNNMDHATAVLITQIYGWVNADLGSNEFEFYRNHIRPGASFGFNRKSIEEFEMLLATSRVRLDHIDELYKEVVWKH